MRLTLVMLGALILAGLARPAAAVTFTDVPDDHWAYEALDYLQQAGLVEGFPDGTFRGDRPFTRYEMAMVIARVFTKIQDWQAMMASGQMPEGAQNVDMAEVNSRLDRLAEEFRDELAGLGARVTAVEDEQTRMRGEVTDLRELLKNSGLSGTARWRSGYYVATGSKSFCNEPGYEGLITLNYSFKPDPSIDFKFSLTAAEEEGPAGTGFIPGVNNEYGATTPGSLPNNRFSNSSSFVLDEAYFKYYWDNAPSMLGNCPTVTGGRQYFSQGEFGLAGENRYRSNYGLRLDTNYGKELSAYVGAYRMDSKALNAPWASGTPAVLQSDAVTLHGDDYLLAGLEYHSGEARIPGHDYKLVVRADVSPNGYGMEKYASISGNAEIPWLSDKFLNGIRGEWLYVISNVSGQDPSADLGLANMSMILELDLLNDGKTRISVAGAQIAQLEGLPVLANVDNDPFSEWDFTVNPTKDAFNLSREGPNYFPADFRGVGLRAERAVGKSLKTTLTYYSGQRVDATASDRPGMVRLNFLYPFTPSSTFGLDFIAAGEHNGLEDPIGLVRGEFKINF